MNKKFKPTELQVLSFVILLEQPNYIMESDKLKKEVLKRQERIRQLRDMK